MPTWRPPTTIDDVNGSFDVVFHGGIHAFLEERRVHGHANKPAVVDDEAQLFIALVAQERLEPGRPWV